MDKLEQAVIKISAPRIRIEIKCFFEDLVNYETKKGKLHNNYWNYLLYAGLEVIYSECDLDEYKESNIGEIFYNEEEAKEVWKFCKWFFELTEKIGGNKSDAAYLEHPEWPKVYINAKNVARLMDVNDKEYNFNSCLEEFNNTPYEEWMKQFKKK